jgi:hypothetical protein
MSDRKEASPLLQLAQEFMTRIEQYRNRKHVEERLDSLRVRLNHLRDVSRRAEELSKCHKILSDVTEVELPRGRLSASCKGLSKLIADCKVDPEAIIQPKAFEYENFNDTLNEIKGNLLKVWRRFATPKKETDIVLAAVIEDPSNQQAARKMQSLREQIQDKALDLPKSRNQIEAVAELIKEVNEECDRLAELGFDEEIARFLQRVRSSEGISLQSILDNQRVLDWLKQNNRASTFRVIRN